MRSGGNCGPAPPGTPSHPESIDRDHTRRRMEPLNPSPIRRRHLSPISSHRLAAPPVHTRPKNPRPRNGLAVPGVCAEGMRSVINLSGKPAEFICWLTLCLGGDPPQPPQTIQGRLQLCGLVLYLRKPEVCTLYRFPFANPFHERLEKLVTGTDDLVGRRRREL